MTLYGTLENTYPSTIAYYYSFLTTEKITPTYSEEVGGRGSDCAIVFTNLVMGIVMESKH